LNCLYDGLLFFILKETYKPIIIAKISIGKIIIQNNIKS